MIVWELIKSCHFTAIKTKNSLNYHIKLFSLTFISVIVLEAYGDDEEELFDLCSIPLYNCEPGVCVQIDDSSVYCNCSGTDTITSATGSRCSKYSMNDSLILKD